MTDIFHKDFTGLDLHSPGYMQDTDPGAVGAGKYWVDTSAGTGHWALKVRNSTNDGWEGVPSSGGMVYPSAGIAKSTGSAWDTSITDNSANWNTAYGWGDHSSAGYLTSATAATTYLKLDQNIPQTVTNGSPTFYGLNLDNATHTSLLKLRLFGSDPSPLYSGIITWVDNGFFRAGTHIGMDGLNAIAIDENGNFTSFDSDLNIGVRNSYDVGGLITIGTLSSVVRDSRLILGTDIVKISALTSNGFLKTSSSDGTLTVDTNDYLTTSSAASTYAPITEPLSLHIDQSDPQIITATDTDITATDEIYYGDATDSFKIKKDTIQGILDLVPSPDLSAYVPYTGATGDVDLGTNDLTADSLITNKHIYLPDTDDLSGVYGVIYKAGVPFIHNYHKIYAVNGTTPLDGQNLFIGKDAGNFTLGNTAVNSYESSNNVGIGKEALKSVTTGYDNIAIGALSSSKINSGRGNVYIGGNAGAETTALSFNVGIGQDSVKSAIASGGNLTAVGYETLMSVKDGGSMVAFGTSAGRTTVNGNHSSFFGFKSGYYARGEVSTFIGSEAGYGGSSTSSSGAYNTAMGYQALRSFTSGLRNTAIGQTAGYSISSGQRNTIVGSEAMYGLTTGSYNTAIGEGAGRYYSTGTSAHTSGTYSVFLGRLTRPLGNAQTNQIVIGNDAVGFGSNTVTIGNNSITDTYLKGNVVIQDDNDKLFLGTGNDASITYNGTNLIINPKEVGSGYLQVDGQILATDKIMFTQTDGNEYIDSLADGYMDYGATTAHRFSGKVGIGTSSPVQALDVTGRGYLRRATTTSPLAWDFVNTSSQTMATFFTAGAANQFLIGANSGDSGFRSMGGKFLIGAGPAVAVEPPVALSVETDGEIRMVQDYVSGAEGCLTFGAGQDADMGYNGTNLIINPKVVGSGILEVLGDIKAVNAEFTGKLTVAGEIDPTAIDFTQVSTPSNPASGHNKIYFKSDNKLYKLTSSGVESEVGGGGGSQTPWESDIDANGYELDNPTAINFSNAVITDGGGYFIGGTGIQTGVYNGKPYYYTAEGIYLYWNATEDSWYMSCGLTDEPTQYFYSDSGDLEGSYTAGGPDWNGRTATVALSTISVSAMGVTKGSNKIIDWFTDGGVTIGTYGDYPIRLFVNNNVSPDIEIATTGIRFHDAYTFPTNDGSEGYCLKTDGLGSIYWGLPSVEWADISGNQSDISLSGFNNDLTTDNLTEGSTNLYYTDGKVDTWLTNKGGYTGDLNDSTSTKIADVVDGLITSVYY